MKHLQQYIKIYILCLLVALNICVWYAVHFEDHHGLLTVAFLDIGQGDSIFIQAPNGNEVVVDGGPTNATIEQIGKLMPFYDRSLDMLVVTNPDKDHYFSFIDILKLYHVGTVLEPGTQSPSATYKELENRIHEQKVPKVLAKRGMEIALDQNVSLLVLFPDRDVSGLTTNDGSIVMKLIYGNTSVLLTGDSPQKIENYLITLDGDMLQSDVLKAGHHGSRTATGEPYVQVVKPRYAVISDGKNNKYGHPHKETLDTLNKYHIPILRTDQLGTIIIHSDGRKLWFEK